MGPGVDTCLGGSRFRTCGARAACTRRDAAVCRGRPGGWLALGAPRGEQPGRARAGGAARDVAAPASGTRPRRSGSGSSCGGPARRRAGGGGCPASADGSQLGGPRTTAATRWRSSRAPRTTPEPSSQPALRRRPSIPAPRSSRGAPALGRTAAPLRHRSRSDGRREGTSPSRTAAPPHRVGNEPVGAAGARKGEWAEAARLEWECGTRPGTWPQPWPLGCL